MKDYKRYGKIKKHDIDYKDTYNNFIKMLVTPLKTTFHIEFFLITYNNDKTIIEQLKKDFNIKPKQLHLYDEAFKKKHLPLSMTNIRHATMMRQGIHSVKSYEIHNKIKFSHILITRFDLLYFKKINSNFFDLNIINFGWINELKGIDDNFVFIPNQYIEEFNNYLSKVLNGEIIVHGYWKITK